MPRSAMKRNFHVILLAGGSGTRFWPRSRSTLPKQFLPLSGKDPLLVATWKRVRKLAPPSRIWVAAPAALVEPISAMLPALRPENIIIEPSPRDTAPAVALACATVSRAVPGAVVGIFPTDHVIRDIPSFVRTVSVAAESAAGGSLVCLGVQPDRPATGFGYLKCAVLPGDMRAVRVERFIEKPDAARARRYLVSGRYLWNGGMFVWQVSSFERELAKTAPEILRAVQKYLKGSKRSWSEATRLSVDYAVMEKASDVRVVPLKAGWDDVGSWDAVADLRSETMDDSGKHIFIDSEDAIVFSDSRLVAVVGVPGVVVVDSDDALLVVSRDRAERVKEVVQVLKDRKRKDLL